MSLGPNPGLHGERKTNIGYVLDFGQWRIRQSWRTVLTIKSSGKDRAFISLGPPIGYRYRSARDSLLAFRLKSALAKNYVLNTPLPNPPSHGRARVLLVFLFLMYVLFSVLACSFVMCRWVICIDLWEFRSMYTLWSNDFDVHWYSSLRNHTHGTHQTRWSARRRDLYLTTTNTHKLQTTMSTVGFETANLASQRLQTHASDRVVTEIGLLLTFHSLYSKNVDHMSVSGNPNICR
jgi:nitrate reductase NapE component